MSHKPDDFDKPIDLTPVPTATQCVCGRIVAGDGSTCTHGLPEAIEPEIPAYWRYAFPRLQSENEILRKIVEDERGVPADVQIARHDDALPLRLQEMNMVKPFDPAGIGKRHMVVFASDYAALEARCREAETHREKNRETAVALQLRVSELEAALQLIGNELSLHADQGPAGEAFRALLVPTLETGAERTKVPHIDVIEAFCLCRGCVKLRSL